MLKKLVLDLSGEDDELRWRAAIALARAGAPAVPCLIEALGHDNPAVQVAAAHAVRDMREPGAAVVPALVANLSRQGTWEAHQVGTPIEVRRTAMGALAQLGKPALEAVPALVAVLRDNELEGLDAPQRHLKTIFELRGTAAWVLHKLGPEAARRDREVIPALATALGDPERMVRLNAAAALGDMGAATKEAVPALLEALRHADQCTRIYAALALGTLGGEAAPYVPELLACHDSIRLDELSRERISETIHAVSGVRPRVEPEAAPPPATAKWPALDRTDFLLAVQPLQTQSQAFDQDQLTRAFLDARLANAFCFWPDHTWYNTPIPTADQMAHWGMAGIWYYFTEDIFNPKQQRDWGYASITDYNRSVIERILAMGEKLGNDRCYWSVGHEHMDSLHGWGINLDGDRSLPDFRTKKEGYEYYASWIRTSLHKRHWNIAYANWRPQKFHMGWDVRSPASWEFIDEHDIDTSPVTMMNGGVAPVLAHAAFDILPQIGMYWWECQVEGTSLQIGSAYTRGAARQYGKKWLLDASPWSIVHGDPRKDKNGNWKGGCTPATQLRTWIYGYLCGADIVFEEASAITHFFLSSEKHPVLTETGRAAREAARFCFELCPERGESYNPVGVLLEHEHGFEPRPHTNFRGDGAWGCMPKGENEWAIEKFWYLAYPDHSTVPDREDAAPEDKPGMEPRILTGGPFGDCFDVVTDHCPEAVLHRYPRLKTLGGIVVAGDLRQRLERYVQAGGQLLLNAAHLADETAGDSMTGLRFGDWVRDRTGSGVSCMVRKTQPTSAKVLQETADGHPLITENAVGDGKVYTVTARHNLGGEEIDAGSSWLVEVSDFLKEWVARVWPVRVATTSGGDPQVLLSRLPRGWLVALGNHDRRPWQGNVAIQLPGDGSVRITDIWSGQSKASAATDGTVEFAAQAESHAFAVYLVEERHP